MPISGKPPVGQPNKPFSISQQNGEQVDAVRSKIASLMDGVTEKRGAAPAATPNAVDKPTPPAKLNSEENATQRTTATAQSQPQSSGWPAADEWPRRSHGQPAAPQTDATDEEQNRSHTPPEQPHWRTATTPPYEAPSYANNTNEPLPGYGPTSEDRAQARLNERPLGTENENPSSRPSKEPQSPVTDEAVRQREVNAANAINIKGRAGGILIEIGNGNWPLLMAALSERLAGAGNFFRNGAVALDLAARPLTEQELHHLHKMLSDQTLELVLVRTGSQETFQVALDMGLAVQLESSEGETSVSAQPAHSNLSSEPHFVYAGHLRAGQVLQRGEHILVIGDVNPGATVISNGDILVWGHLRGLAHAGAGGDTRAVIAALNLAAVQLRIGHYVAFAPEPTPKRRWGRQQTPIKQAEVAYISGERIAVDPWDATKFGGIAALRQS